MVDECERLRALRRIHERNLTQVNKLASEIDYRKAILLRSWALQYTQLISRLDRIIAIQDCYEYQQAFEFGRRKSRKVRSRRSPKKSKR